VIIGSDTVEKKILDQVVPSSTDERKLEQIIDKLIIRVREEILKFSDVMIEPVLVGSTAKGTYLRDSLDIDLFLVFSYEISEKDLERIGLSIGRSVLSDQEECYAQHPYVRGTFEGFTVEIVPCYQIGDASEKRSAVDRTPLHTKYIIEHVPNDQRNEVRLFKQFLKGVGVYGADAEVEGFSGYLCELIVLYYGSFQKTVESCAEWMLGVSLRLNEAVSPVFDSPLVFIDPVDLDRNVASALIRRNFDRFICACKAYCENPSVKFFFPKPLKDWSLKRIEKHLSNCLVVGVEFPRPDIIVENLFPQLRKATRAIRDTAKAHGFCVSDAMFFVTDKVVGVIVIPSEMNLSSTMLHMGPPVHLKQNAAEFLEKWQDHENTVEYPFKQNGRWYVKIKREYTSLVALLDAVVPSLSLGRHISGKPAQEYRIKGKEDLISLNLQNFWTRYLDRQMPWER
jgi:tRNA nucleotidyltransferase (CCA-adding enzyme)